MTIEQGLAVVRSIENGLIVSCQAHDHSALNQPRVISAMAVAAQQNEAVGVRINGMRNIKAVRRTVDIPVIGIEKLSLPGYRVYITPTCDSVRRVCLAGADIIAMDFTHRKRPRGQSLAEIIKYAKQNLGAVIMADVATLEEGIRAAELGADLVATTLYGYTDTTQKCHGPAFEVLRDLVRQVKIPVVLEGWVQTPDEVRKAFDLGAYAVVVGSAITNIEWLVQRFVEATPRVQHRPRHSQVE